MSNLRFYSYKGWGTYTRRVMGYSQAVRVGDRIEISGQGGWDGSVDGPPKIKENVREEIAQAFRNVDTNLKDAGGQGWPQVFRVNSYHTEITPDIAAAMVEEFGKWMPDHKPIWTEIGVKQLGSPDMHVEIEVVAYDPK